METDFKPDNTHPALRSHSHDPENDLLKRYVVERKLYPNNGWLAVKSFNSTQESSEWLLNYIGEFAGSRHRTFDQVDNKVVYDDGLD